MVHKIGPKEQQRIDLRLKRFNERGPERRPFFRKAVADALPAIKKQLTEAVAKATSKPNNAPVEASAPAKEKTMKKKAKAKTASAPKRSVGDAAANLRAAKAKKPVAARAKTVPALDVAAFVCREGGASMAELEKKFGIDAHPMRAKIHYVRHKLGYDVETKDGRYLGTAPKAA